MVSKCVKCKRIENKDNLHCIVCKSICHLKCGGVSKELFDKIAEIPNLGWTCNNCIDFWEGLHNLIIIKEKQYEIQENVKLLQVNHEKLSEDLTDMNLLMENTTSIMKNIKYGMSFEKEAGLVPELNEKDNDNMKEEISKENDVQISTEPEADHENDGTLEDDEYNDIDVNFNDITLEKNSISNEKKNRGSNYLCPLCNKKKGNVFRHLKSKTHGILDPEVLLSHKPLYKYKKSGTRVICNICKSSVTRIKPHLRIKHKLNDAKLFEESEKGIKTFPSGEFFNKIIHEIKKAKRLPIAVASIVEMLHADEKNKSTRMEYNSLNSNNGITLYNDLEVKDIMIFEQVTEDQYS